MSFAKEDVLGYECKHVVHCAPKDWSLPELHLVKEVVHLKDGTKVPKLRFIKDFKRKFWVTKEGARNHKDKKEREKLTNLIEYQSTQRDLIRNIGKALKNPGLRGSLKQVCRNPYIYGADILSTAVIKKQYQDSNPGLDSLYRVAALDIETDMILGTKEVMMCTVTMGNKVYTVVQQQFVKGHTHVEEQLRKLMDLYLGDVVKRRQIEWELLFVDSAAEVVIKSIQKCHAWMPDILAIWNMDFDIPKMVEALEQAGIDPAKVFSDPSVPDAYKFYWYKQGSATLVTASGVHKPKAPPERWHTVFTPASFYVIDAMCAYRAIRNQKPKEPSYKLDDILKLVINKGKLKFSQADKASGPDWHVLMQSDFPLEYIIYNVYDTVGMLDLDETTQDLQLALAQNSGCSDFQHFASQPRRLVNAFHYELLEEGYAIGTTADEMSSELDKYVIGTENWIIALRAFLIHENGLRVTLDGQSLVSSIYAHVADLDVSAAYPTNEVVCNISKETTSRELSTITGVSEEVRRMQGINLAAGHTNAVEFSVNMFGVPDFDTLLNAYLHDRVHAENLLL